MVDVIDFQIRISLIDQFTESCAFLIERNIRQFGKAWVQRSKALRCCLGPWEFLFVEGQRAIFTIDRYQLAIEMAILNGVVGTLLADISQRVNRFTVNAFQRRNRIGAHTLVRLRMLGTQARIAIIEERR